MRAEQMRGRLQALGRRVTVQRQAVLKALGGLGCAQDAVQIYFEARRIYPQLGLVTVYRTLDALSARGLVQPIFLGDGRTRYELTDEGRHHHHLVCVACGSIETLDGCLFEAVEGTRLGRGFEVTAHRLELFGYCARCGLKRNRSRPHRPK